MKRLQPPGPPPGGLFGKIVAIVVGAAIVVAAFVFSIFFLLAALGVVLIIGLRFAWKTRHLRKQMREQMRDVNDPLRTEAETAGNERGRVIEGEVIRDPEARDSGSAPETPAP